MPRIKRLRSPFYVTALLLLLSATAVAYGQQTDTDGRSGSQELRNGTGINIVSSPNYQVRKGEQMLPAELDPNQTATSSNGWRGKSATPTVPSHSASTERVNNLANLEALLNIIANAGEGLGITNGGPMFLLGCVLFYLPDRKKLAPLFVTLGIVGFVFGLALPGAINWLVASARDAGLFN